MCEHARALYWRLTGRAMRRDPETGLGRFEWMAESEEDIGEVERRAAKAWLAGGSWKGEKIRRREREERRAKRLIAEQARRFVTFMRQGGGQAVGLSGRPVEAGEEVFIEISKAARGRVRRRRMDGGPAQMRRTGSRPNEEGAAPDRWGRWRVDKIVEVRWRRGGTRGRECRVMEVRLRWAGLDPHSDLPYQDSWVEALGRDGEGVMILSPELRKAAMEMERERFGVRAPPSRAGDKGEKGTGVTCKAAATAKWQGCFRSDKRGREEAVADMCRGVRSRVRILEEGRKEVRGVEWALADLRRQRSEIGSLSGQGPKRRKRWAVVRDCDDGGYDDAEA